MSTPLIAIASVIMVSAFGTGLAQAACTQNDIKLKYTEIGQLIQAEQAGDPNAAAVMMTKMHQVQDEMTSGEINTVQFCRAYDALIHQMKTNR
jgi:hypothetical protein